MRRVISLRTFLSLSFLVNILSIQHITAQGNYQIYDYEEPRIGTTPNEVEWAKIANGINITWACRDVHYSLHEVPKVEHRHEATIHAWKGERTNIQALLYSKKDEGKIHLYMTEWSKDGKTTGINGAEAHFVNYVITDDYKACGNHLSGLGVHHYNYQAVVSCLCEVVVKFCNVSHSRIVFSVTLRVPNAAPGGRGALC